MKRLKRLWERLSLWWAIRQWLREQGRVQARKGER